MLTFPSGTAFERRFLCIWTLVLSQTLSCSQEESAGSQRWDLEALTTSLRSSIRHLYGPFLSTSQLFLDINGYTGALNADTRHFQFFFEMGSILFACYQGKKILGREFSTRRASKEVLYIPLNKRREKPVCGTIMTGSSPYF